MDQGISGDAKKLELIHNECGQLQGFNVQVVFFRKVSRGGDLQKQQAVYEGDASAGVGGGQIRPGLIAPVFTIFQRLAVPKTDCAFCRASLEKNILCAPMQLSANAAIYLLQSRG